MPLCKSASQTKCLNRRQTGDASSPQQCGVILVDAAERENGNRRGRRQRLETPGSKMLRPRMTLRREYGRQESEMRADRRRAGEIRSAVRGGGDDEPSLF